MTNESKNSVKIAVRERPPRNSIIYKNLQDECVTFVEKAVLCDGKPFVFDQIFRSEISQLEVFDSLAAPLVERSLEGFNSTIFAYGQSGTGKSFSMGLNPDSFGTESMGIIPRSMERIFENIENSGESITICCSFIEIYNEKAYDLFDNVNNQRPMFRPNDPVKKDIKSVKSGFQLLREAHKIRRVRCTSLNSESSRAHSIITIHIFKDNGNGSRTKSCLNLVDLAGTEGVRKTGHQGMALTEGNHINSSLLAVSKIINALSMGHKIFSFRDSVLTKVLQESFSTKAYLALLVCISSNYEDLTETRSALQFAKNAKNINMSSQLSKEIEIIKKNTPVKPAFFSANKATTVKKRTLSSTFNSVSKVPRISASKINQSELFKRPSTQRQLSYDLTTPNIRATISPPSGMESISELSSLIPATTVVENVPRRRNYRISSIESIDSRYSIQSLNVSTSTVIEELPTTRAPPASDSPLIRKCMDIFSNAMSKKLEMFQETLQTPAPSKPSFDAEIVRTMIRQELSHILTTQKQYPHSGSNELEDSPIHQYSRRPSNERRISNRGRSTSPSMPSITEEGDGSSSPITGASKTIIATKTPMRTGSPIIVSTTPGTPTTPLRASDNSPSPTHETAFKVPFAINRVPAPEAIAKDSNETVFKVPAMIAIEAPKRMTSIRRSMRLSVCRTPPNLNERRMHKRMIETRKKELPVRKTRRDTLHKILNPEIQKNPEKMKSEMKKNLLKLFNDGESKEIQKLPTFGPKRAQNVIIFRSLNGKFKDFNSIREVPIWSDKTWSNFLTLQCLNE